MFRNLREKIAAAIQCPKASQWLIVGLLALGVQVAVVQKSTRLDLLRVWNTIGQHGLWRSAHFNQGRDYANYLKFLNETIPYYGRVVLPPAEVKPGEMGRTPFMQFFLAPRRVFNCTDLACLENLSRENTYILIVGDFPGQVDLEAEGARQMFNENWGVLLPEGAQAGGQGAWRPFENGREIAIAFAWPALWLGALALSGAIFAQRLAPGLSLATKLALGYGLGLGGFTLGAAAFSLAGVPLRPGLLLWITGGLLAVALVMAFCLRPGLRFSNANTARPKPGGWEIAFLALAGVALVLSVGKGYHSADEILLWGAKGYGIASDGTLLSVTEWGTNTVAYPLHIPMLIASFRLLFTENLPAGKIAFSGYYLSLLWLCYGFLVQGGVSRRLAGISTLLVATTPIVLRHAMIAYANLPLAFYLAGGALLLNDSLRQAKLAHNRAPKDQGSVLPVRLQKGPVALSGLFFAAAAWSRPEGLALACLALGLALALAGFKKLWLPARHWAWLPVALLVYGLFWWVLKAQVYTRQLAKSGLAASALEQALRGNLHVDEALYVLRSFFSTTVDLKSWGVLGAGAMLVLILLLLHSPARKRGWLLALIGLLYTSAILGMYYLASYDTIHDISWWVSTGLDRMLLPGFLLLWLAGFLSLAGSDHRTS
ncbi:MAG: hypothetical protein JXA78_06465 [Anaerolineales bacterium]|nr:hypothetical protein [Anaerolineales bacterium]